METTNEKVNEFALAAETWVRKDNEARAKLRAEDKPVPLESKFRYALQDKMLIRAKPVLRNMTDEIDRINIDHCVEGFASDGKTKVIMREPGGSLCYTKEGQKARNNELKKWIRVDKVEIEPYMAKGDIPDDLTFEEREAFADFIIPRAPEREDA